MWTKLLPVFTLCGAAAIAADYNVLDHGLKADGRSDNTAAMAALLAKTAPGDTIRFPGGTYFFTGDIRLDGTGLTLDGSGTILFEHKDDDPAWNDNRKINITGKKIAVRNLKVTSTAKTRSAVYGLVSCFDADDVRIENLEIYNSPSTAIYTIHSSRIWILNNFVHDQWADGIHVSRSSDQVLIHGNVIERNGDDGIGVVSYHGPEPWNRHPRNNRIIMTDNIISRTPARGICASGGNLTIRGNIISQTGKAGIICTAEGWISAYTLIEGNTVFDVGTAEKYGFDFYDTRGTRSGIHVQYNRDMMILNNMIYNARQGCGISVTSSPDVTVSGNRITNCVRGIQADIPAAFGTGEKFNPEWLREMYGDKSYQAVGDIPGCDNLTVSGNTVRDCMTDGIWVSGLKDRPNMNVVVSGNILGGNNRSKQPNVRDVWSAYCTSLTMSGNISQGGEGAPLSPVQGSAGCTANAAR